MTVQGCSQSGKMAKQNLREFRSQVARLKKAGLISPVDARSATPGMLRTSGKRKDTLKFWVAKYDDFLSGKATPVKLSKEELKIRKKMGETVVGDIALVTHSAGQTATRTKRGVSIKSADGIERVQIPVEYHNLEQWLRDAKKDSANIDRMKAGREWWAFQFHGRDSYMVYHDIDDLLEDLARYESIAQSLNTGSARDMNESYRNLAIFKVTGSTRWGKHKAQQVSERRQKYSAMKQKKRMKRLEDGPPAKLARFHEQQAKAQQAYRDRLKGKELAKYKKAAKKRAAKWRAKNHDSKRKND